MKLYPAIDIRDGQAVRLTQGDYERETVYEANPLDAARTWVEQGAKWLHVVDLDGARTGKPANLNHLTAIARELDARVQFGGGLRNIDAVENALGAGANRVIIGTAALRDQDFLAQAVSRFGDRVVVSLDAKGGHAQAQGWTEPTSHGVEELLAQLDRVGVETIIYTNIERDGMLAGIDSAELREVCGWTRAAVIASGGIGQIDDIKALRALELPNLDGVIVGKAIYEQRFTVTEALDVLTWSS